MKKANVFVDMDGVLSVYERALEEVMYGEGFFLNRPPIFNIINLVKEMIKEDKYNVYILSSVIESPYCVDEKNIWLDKFLPEVEYDNRVFLPFGIIKRDAAQQEVDTKGRVNVLLDDYSENLFHWNFNEALPIKVMNGINSRFGTWLNHNPEAVISSDNSIKDNLRIIDELVALKESELDGVAGTITVLNHPLITHKLAILRNKETNTRDFSQILKETATLMAYEVMRDLPTEDILIETPMTTTFSKQISKEIVLIPILRAGLGMLDGIRDLVPFAKVGHLGMYRDEETLQPVEYYSKMPNLQGAVVMVLDPMTATGGSAIGAINILKENGASNIKLVSIVASEQGFRAVRSAHPDVDIYLAAKDAELNDVGYITPGLGDAGDRIFGTK